MRGQKLISVYVYSIYTIGDKVVKDAQAATASLLEALDRILDKGITIDTFTQVSLASILLTIEDREIVGSIETYLRYAERVHEIGLVAAPAPSIDDAVGASLGGSRFHNAFLKCRNNRV